MPFSAQTPASSSGVEAPSRKLKAERACSSVYISRTFPPRTSSGTARRSRSGKFRVAARWKTKARLRKARLPRHCDPKPAGFRSPTPRGSRLSSRHHSPEVRQGPEAAITSPCISEKEMCAGRPSRKATAARGAGRKARNAAKAARSPRLSVFSRIVFSRIVFSRNSGVSRAGRKRLISNASGRWLSGMRGEPTREWPTRFASRARVSSNFSGSGEEGTNNPCCIARGAAGSAARKICTIGAPGRIGLANAGAAASKAFWNRAWARAG